MVLVFNKNKKRNPSGGNGHGDMREYQTRLGLLCDIAEEASSITQVSTLLERILKVTQRTVGAAITSVFLKDEARTRVQLPIMVTKYEDVMRRQAAAIQSDIADVVATDATPVLSNYVATDVRFHQDSQKPAVSVVRSLIAAPILKGKSVIGVLMAANKEDSGGFTQRDFEVLKGFAATEAVILLVSLERTAVNNVNCLTINENLLEGYRNTVHELASTIDVKDAQVYAHARRTKEYAMLAASVLPLQPRELQAIEFGALLHDIGKIGIDSRILCKPGPLTDEEWKIIYEHPLKGADILKDIPHLKDATNIVLCHHERYDGTGYPRKIKGEEIPIGARLVSVANAFDTMTTDNPYRAALSVDDAMKELFNGIGTQFCPKAVEAFVSAYKKHPSHPPADDTPGAIKTGEDKSPANRVIMVDKGPKDTKNLIIKVKKEAKEARKLKKKAEKEAKEARKRAAKEAEEARKRAVKEAAEARIKAEQEAKQAKIIAEKEDREARLARIKAEQEAKEARIKAEQEAREAKILAEKEAKEARIKAEQEAREAKIKAEQEAKEARIKAAQEAEEARVRTAKEAREAKIQAIKAEREAREAKARADKEAEEARIQARIKGEKEAREAKIQKIEADREAKEAKNKIREAPKKPTRVEPSPKVDTAKMDAEICAGNVRLVVSIKTPNEEVKALGRDLEKIQGVKILMLSHSEEDGHLFLLALQKPITLLRYIRQIPRVESVSKKGGEITVVLRDNAS
jgi:HD-GYP domain-containing protein (c-di-GMP phosphodiesterase class II)